MSLYVDVCLHRGGATRRQVEKEKEYWSRMSHIVSEKGCRVWGVLEKQLGRYHHLLEDRADSLHTVQSLQQQNGELRALLNQYLTSRVNGELQIPPTQVI
jgi:dynein regulatry complex protein 1